MNAIFDRSAPGVRITVLPDPKATEGAPLDLAGRIVGFTFEDSERKADKLALQLDNFDLALFDREDLAGGTVIEVSWGYPGRMAPPRRVVVQKLKGFQTLTVEARALSVLMDREARTRTFENATRSEVARAIAAEHGYSDGFTDIEDTPERFDAILQAGESDARLLRRLAAEEGFELFVDASGFHFHVRRQEAAPTHTFTWYADPGRGDVMSVNVESDLARRAGKVRVKGRDPKRKTTIDASASNETADRTTLADVLEVVDPETGATTLQERTSTESVHASTSSTAEEAAREAQARFRQAERATVKLTMQVVGDPTLHAKSIVEVRGISALLSGKYYVTDVRHVVSASGYVSDLRLVRDGSGRRARKLAREQAGVKNTSARKKPGELTQVEVVDAESGTTHIEYRQDGQVLGSEDPESQSSQPR